MQVLSRATHDFGDARRVLDGVPHVDEGLLFLIVVDLDRRQPGVEVLYVIAKVLDGLQAIAEISGGERQRHEGLNQLHLVNPKFNFSSLGTASSVNLDSSFGVTSPYGFTTNQPKNASFVLRPETVHLSVSTLGETEVEKETKINLFSALEKGEKSNYFPLFVKEDRPSGKRKSTLRWEPKSFWLPPLQRGRLSHI